MVQFELNLDAQFYTYSFFSFEFGYIWVASSYLSFFACIESFLLIGIMHTVKQSVINELNYVPKLYPHAGFRRWFGNHHLKWYINTRYISWRLLDNYRRERGESVAASFLGSVPPLPLLLRRPFWQRRRRGVRNWPPDVYACLGFR